MRYGRDMDWFMELNGLDFDLARLAKAFTTPPVAIWKEGECYQLRDESLDDADDAEYVRSELQQTLSRINALARLEWGDHEDVRSGGVGHANTAGGTTWYDSATLVGRARVTGTATVIGPHGQPVPDSPSPLPTKLHLAATDRDVDDALYFLQRPDPSWSELYKAYEVVRGDVGEIADRGWATKKELSRFTGTANHQDAAGREARHARVRKEPLADPMPLNDARILVRSVVTAWLNEKL
jgi:hypothetical protein